MLAPRKLKRRKPHRPKVKGVALRNNAIAFGSYGLKAMAGGWIQAKQIESARRVISKYTRRGGKVWIRIFPHRVITGKGTQATMGSGKGVLDYYAAVVKPGTMIFELDGLPEDQSRQALLLAGYKLPIKVSFVKK